MVLLPLLSSAQVIVTWGKPELLTQGNTWMIADSTPVGSIVKTISLKGVELQEHEKIYSFALQNSLMENPFWVEPSNGNVYLNRSLEGMVSHIDKKI